MDGLNDTQRYFVEEHIEDFRDGLIGRSRRSRTCSWSWHLVLTRQPRL
jgi:hypothetical protein